MCRLSAFLLAPSKIQEKGAQGSTTASALSSTHRTPIVDGSRWGAAKHAASSNVKAARETRSSPSAASSATRWTPSSSSSDGRADASASSASCASAIVREAERPSGAADAHVTSHRTGTILSGALILRRGPVLSLRKQSCVTRPPNI
eukprot:4478972-Pleurochrysis_carterae.AAC.3